MAVTTEYQLGDDIQNAPMPSHRHWSDLPLGPSLWLLNALRCWSSRDSRFRPPRPTPRGLPPPVALIGGKALKGETVTRAIFQSLSLLFVSSNAPAWVSLAHGASIARDVRGGARRGGAASPRTLRPSQPQPRPSPHVSPPRASPPPPAPVRMLSTEKAPPTAASGGQAQSGGSEQRGPEAGRPLRRRALPGEAPGTRPERRPRAVAAGGSVSRESPLLTALYWLPNVIFLKKVKMLFLLTCNDSIIVFLK